MCWKSNKKPKQRTAKEDVIVYKLLIKTDDPNVMMSPINPFEYTFHHKYENPPMKIIKNVEDGNTEYMKDFIHFLLLMVHKRLIYIILCINL